MTYNEIFDNSNTLNENETKVLDACIAVAQSYGEGPYFCQDEVAVEGMNKNALKGYLSQLKQKGFIELLPRGEYYFDWEIACGYDQFFEVFMAD